MAHVIPFFLSSFSTKQLIDYEVIVSLTKIKLRSPFLVFSLAFWASKVSQQAKESACLKYKTSGFWKTFYTMSLWASREDLEFFYRNGAHAEAMKKSPVLAKKIITHTFEADNIPPLKRVKRILKKGKVISF